MAQLLEPDLVQRNTAPAKKARGLAEPNKGTRARPAVRGAGILQGVVTTSVRWPRADAEGPPRFRVRVGATVAAFDVNRFDGGGVPEPQRLALGPLLCAEAENGKWSFDS